MERPKVNLIPQPIDRIIDFLVIIGILILIGLPIYYFSLLPETLPIHFNFKGDVDAIGNKSSIWILTMSGAVCSLLMLMANKNPHRFNLPIKVTETNAEQVYSLSTRMLRLSNLLTVTIFIYLTYQIIQIGVGQEENLQIIPLCIHVLLLFFVISFFTIKIKKLGQNSIL